MPGFKVCDAVHLLLQEYRSEKAIDRLFVDVDRAYRDGANILDFV